MLAPKAGPQSQFGQSFMPSVRQLGNQSVSHSVGQSISSASDGGGGVAAVVTDTPCQPIISVLTAG